MFYFSFIYLLCFSYIPGFIFSLLLRSWNEVNFQTVLVKCFLLSVQLCSPQIYLECLLCLLWFKCKISLMGLCVWTLGSQLILLFGKEVGPLRRLWEGSGSLEAFFLTVEDCNLLPCFLQRWGNQNKPSPLKLHFVRQMLVVVTRN